MPRASPSSLQVQSSSATAIKNACSPQQALHLFKSRLIRTPKHFDPFDGHAAVFTIKSCSSSSSSSTLIPFLIPHLHAHLLRTNLLSYVHVSTALLHAYSLSSSSFTYARHLFDEIPNRNIITTNTMISCYCKRSDLTSARALFDQMGTRDVASWSAMIGGYMSRGRRAHGFSLFREMASNGWKPDKHLLVTLLSGCSDTGSLRIAGKTIHAYAVRNALDVSLQLGTKLINMYARCGCLRSAALVFERMEGKNVAHWTAMICALASHGHGQQAVLYFEAMKRAGVRPNDITFTGVLSACCHVGLVTQGQEYYRSMLEEFGFEPSVHHYGCMVDLYARAGRLEDACSVVESMKVEPNIVVWTSILCGCKEYNNFKVAERVISRVWESGVPDDDGGGVYTLIADLYAMGGDWNGVERVRKLIDSLNVKKNRGSSFVEIKHVSASIG